MRNIKDIISKIGILILSVQVLFSACSDPIVESNPSDGSEAMIPIVIKMKDLAALSTYGTDYTNVTDTAGSDLENAIHDVMVYVFDNSFICEKIIPVTVVAGFPPVSDTVMVKSGNKHLLAIVNALANNMTTLPTTEASAIYPDLISLMSNPPLTTQPASPFLMTGRKMNVNLPPDWTKTAPYNVEIEVERACAKITMNVSQKILSGGVPVYYNIVLTKVAMYNGAESVALFELPSPSPSLTYSISDSTSLLDPVPVNPVYLAVPDSFYTYESLCGSDTSKAVKLAIEATVNSTLRRAEFYLGEDYLTIPGDTVYNVKRNYWYVVNVDIIKPGMDSIYITIKACPWTIADPIDTIAGVGGEFSTALPFKLVKNLVYDEMLLTNSAGRSYAAINNHSKGASFIDFKVTSGTDWMFDVKDNTPRNQNVYWSLDSATWTSFSTQKASGKGIDDWQRIYIYRPYLENNEPRLGPSLYVTLNNIHKQDFIIQPRDTFPIPTNSYILRPQLTGAPVNETRAYIPLAGVFNHWENEILDNHVFRSYPITASVLWQDDSLRRVVQNVHVINANNPDSAYIYAEAGAPGNAVIAMYLSTEKYWTFHVWVTEYNPYEAAGQKFYQTGTVKNVFMDRNLGAMSNTWDDKGNARGLFYQFGRKDPFPRGQDWANSPPWEWFENDPPYTRIPTVGTRTATLTPVSSDFRPRVALQLVLNYPDVFITRGVGEDWTLSIEDTLLWSSRGGNKTAYDPCPEGWRIPEVPQPYVTGYFPWDGDLLGNGANRFTNSLANGWYSPLVGYYPKSGYIDASRALISSGDEARFWTSYSTNTNMARGLFFDDNTTFRPINSTSLDKAWGASVRCVVDKNYIRNAENGGLFGTGINNLKNELLP